MRLSLQMACDRKGCEARLSLEAIISDDAKDTGKYAPEAVIKSLGWYRHPETRKVFCPDCQDQRAYEGT